MDVENTSPSRFFRYHSSGDIPDEGYLDMMVRVAEKCPYTEFLCFTKKFEMVNNYISDHNSLLPCNLHLVYSAWGDFIPENQYGLPTAYIEFKKGEAKIPENAMPCSGYCGACVQTGRSCWDMERGCNDCVVFKQH